MREHLQTDKACLKLWLDLVMHSVAQETSLCNREVMKVPKVKTSQLFYARSREIGQMNRKKDIRASLPRLKTDG
jgi:hypothetical protein